MDTKRIPRPHGVNKIQNKSENGETSAGKLFRKHEPMEFLILQHICNHSIRKVAPDGTVSTLAGSNEGEDWFADSAAADARFNLPSDQ